MTVKAEKDKDAPAGAPLSREQQERFALAALAANDGCWDWDIHTNTEYFSPRWKAMLGYGEDEIANSPEEWQSRLHPDDRERAQAALQAHLAGETPFFELEHRLRHRDGRYRWFLARGVTLRDDAGRPSHMVGAHTDITKRKLADEALRNSEALYRGLVETSPDSIILTALDGRIVMANQRAAELYRYDTSADLVGMKVVELASEGERPLVMQRLHGLLKGEQVQPHEYLLRRRDGTYFPAEVRACVIADKMGRAQAIMTVARDLTDRARAERRLSEQEEQYRRVFEATSDGLIITTLDGHVVEANPAAWEMHGYTREEFIGLHHTAYVHPDHHETLPRYAAAIASGDAVQTRGLNRRKDGSAFPVDLRGTTFLYQGRPHILAVVRDATEQVQAYELLEARVEERTRALSTLLEVSRRVASTLQLEPLLGLILDQLKVVADYRGGALLKLDGEDLVIVEYRGSNPRDQIVGLRFPLARLGPIWEQAQQSRPVMIPDVRVDDPLARGFRAAAGPLMEGPWSYIRSWMGVPLARKGETIGLLSLSIDESDFYTEEHAHLALALASQAGVAMENAKLYERAQEMAALEERARLGRELHDSVTQALFSMTMHARAAQMALERAGDDSSGALDTNLAQLSELTQGALAEMRALIFELRPGALTEEGLGAALRKHAAAVSAREGLAIDVTLPDERVPLTPGVEEHLYRLAQEALHNVVKHAVADHADIRLTAAPEGALVLEIGDDGVGFDPAEVAAGRLGLRTMADRARQIGAGFELCGAPGRGTTVRVTLPCAPAPAGGDGRDG